MRMCAAIHTLESCVMQAQDDIFTVSGDVFGGQLLDVVIAGKEFVSAQLIPG